MNRQNHNKRRAFTMNELMIAGAVIGIIASITVPTLLVDTNKKRNQISKDKVNLAMMSALKAMRIEGNLTGNDTTENFVGELKKHLNINKICSKNELSKCFTNNFVFAGEDKNISQFSTADDLGKDWNTNVNGLILNDGASMLIAYNPNCSKFALNNCMVAIYDTTKGKSGTSLTVNNVNLGAYNNTTANNNIGNKIENNEVQQPDNTGNSACGENVILIDLTQWHTLYKFKLDGPAGSTPECLAKNMDKLQNACEATVNDDGYSGMFTAASSGGYSNYGIAIGDPYCQFACIALGTPVTLANGSHKAIENITYDDDLLVWDFDNGRMSSAKPAWIKQAEVADSYNLLTFSDGTQLKTINQHRIFNKDLGKFTYPMTDDTPLGTTTLLADGKEVQLVDKKVVYEPVEFYNLITANHFNCFTSNILTSNRFNNLYPIQDYKFVKDDRELTPYSEYENFVSRDWYEKLRLAEQACDESMKLYLSNLVRLNKKELALV